MPVMINPKYVSPVAQWIAANRVSIDAWLSARQAQRDIDFDEIRTALAGSGVVDPVTGGVVTDGTIAELCRELGAAVRS